MIGIYEVINAAKNEAISLFRQFERDTEAHYIDFEYGKEPWMIVETGENGLFVDAKVKSVELPIDKNSKDLQVFIEEYSNGNDADEWLSIYDARGYTEYGVYIAIIETIKRRLK